MRRTITLLALALLLAAGAAEAQQRVNCPRIPSVSNDPLNRSYRAGDTVPAELLDPPFVWVECGAPALPAAATRAARRVVFLSVTVDESGAVIDVRPRGTIDPEGFYDAAVGAVRQWRTNAPRWRGLPVQAAVAVDVSFAPPSTSAPLAEPAPEAPVTQAPAVESPSMQPPPQPMPSSATPQAAPPAPQPAAPPARSTPTPAEPVTRPPEPVVTPVVETPAPRSEPAPPLATPVITPAPTQATTQRPLPTTEPFVVEYYYKARWGFAEEFWRLFNRNHWPLLRRQMEMGRILEVRAARPRYHATEDGRWDYRVTIVFRSVGDATSPFDTESLERQLFPDFDGYRREERRRFELLLAHWDVPITAVEMEP